LIAIHVPVIPSNQVNPPFPTETWTWVSNLGKTIANNQCMYTVNVKQVSSIVILLFMSLHIQSSVRVVCCVQHAKHIHFASIKCCHLEQSHPLVPAALSAVSQDAQAILQGTGVIIHGCYNLIIFSYALLTLGRHSILQTSTAATSNRGQPEPPTVDQKLHDHWQLLRYVSSIKVRLGPRRLLGMLFAFQDKVLRPLLGTQNLNFEGRLNKLLKYDVELKPLSACAEWLLLP
jgi:hypothetical protein